MRWYKLVFGGGPKGTSQNPPRNRPPVAAVTGVFWYGPRKLSLDQQTRIQNTYEFGIYSHRFMTETVTARLPDELVKRVDAAVSRGAFPSRSEALRTMLEEYLKEHPELFLDSEPELLLGAQLSDRELEKIGGRLFSGVKVARLVGEGRER